MVLSGNESESLSVQNIEGMLRDRVSIRNLADLSTSLLVLDQELTGPLESAKKVSRRGLFTGKLAI